MGPYIEQVYFGEIELGQDLHTSSLLVTPKKREEEVLLDDTAYKDCEADIVIENLSEDYDSSKSDDEAVRGLGTSSLLEVVAKTPTPD